MDESEIRVGKTTVGVPVRRQWEEVGSTQSMERTHEGIVRWSSLVNGVY